MNPHPICRTILFLAAGAMFPGTALAGSSEDFTETFASAPAAPWKWIRENKDAWRVGKQGLEVKIEPGNMWGPSNDAKNILVRPSPPAMPAGGFDITATIHNQPTGQYEQTDLVWYFDDGHMVKIGQEMVDGKLSIVMGREEKDRTTTMGIHPLKTATVRLRLRIEGDTVSGFWQPVPAETGTAKASAPEEPWQKAGTCSAPRPDGGKEHIALMFYQGTLEAPHWSRVSEVTFKEYP
jgi:regulation of enolase protein 1 (concanavalin A-like superfamily)